MILWLLTICGKQWRIFTKLDDEINLNTESGKRPIGKQHEKGKLHARERIEMFLDPGTFVEIDAFGGAPLLQLRHGEKRKAGDGVVTATVWWTAGRFLSMWTILPIWAAPWGNALQENLQGTGSGTGNRMPHRGHP